MGPRTEVSSTRESTTPISAANRVYTTCHLPTLFGPHNDFIVLPKDVCCACTRREEPVRRGGWDEPGRIHAQGSIDHLRTDKPRLVEVVDVITSDSRVSHPLSNRYGEVVDITNINV